VFADTIQVLAPRIEAKHLVLHEKYGKLPEVPVDEKYFRIIVENILSNAVKYTPDGGTIEISMKPLKMGEEFGKKAIQEPSVGFVNADTSLGIREHQKSKMFEKLFRGDNVLDKEEGGTGLGLYIVKAILDQSGGQIWFESTENVGTTFYVALPLTGMRPQDGTRTLS
jgi:two-component system sensor histidine kinase VicK